ncbi:MAG TPA: glucose-6-phosphate isomerase, partial [Rhodobacterales bacterium]|nr:glucose-6-phosphate isomerase [Rhodobacterales bacterium]
MSTADQNDLTGALVGGAAGFIGAKALGASDKWAVVA